MNWIVRAGASWRYFLTSCGPLNWKDSLERVHGRFDLEDGWRYTADYLVALVRRQGETLRTSNFGTGEHYSGGDVESRPADFDFDAFLANAKKI